MSDQRRGRWLGSFVVVAFATWAVIQHRWAWAPDILGRLGAAFAIAVGVEVLVQGASRSRPASAGLAAWFWVLLLDVVFVGVTVLPSPGRTAWCSAPETYCEDGLVPLLVFAGGVLAAIIAGGAASLLTWLRCRSRAGG